jgi:hypothetical protein
MPTFAAYLPKGNYNFGSGVFLRDEGTPQFATSEIAKRRLRVQTIRIFSEFFEYRKIASPLFSGTCDFVS